MENDTPRLEMMLDIETLGLKPGSVITAIGAIVFDANGFHADRFFARLESEPQVKAGLTVDISTVEWWLKQSDEARKATFEGERVQPTTALLKLADFVRYNMPAAIWAKGPQFDVTLLECAYDAFHFQPPWTYRAIRDLRTVLGEAELPLNGAVPAEEGKTAHHAIDDCAYQIRELMAARLKLSIPHTGVIAL